MIHDLKIWPQFFDALASGTKTFEVRKNDRDFRAGDLLRLREWDPLYCGRDPARRRCGYDQLHYTGRWVERRVAYVLDDFFLLAGAPVVVLGLACECLLCRLKRFWKKQNY